jgi:hypothetical protein
MGNQEASRILTSSLVNILRCRIQRGLVQGKFLRRSLLYLPHAQTATASLVI